MVQGTSTVLTLRGVADSCQTIPAAAVTGAGASGRIKEHAISSSPDIGTIPSRPGGLPSHTFLLQRRWYRLQPSEL